MGEQLVDPMSGARAGMSGFGGVRPGIPEASPSGVDPPDRGR